MLTKKTPSGPEYWRLAQKWAARQKNVDIYREITGRNSIPEDRQYWTLCWIQNREPMSEINQLVRMGFLKPEQFHGVDRKLVCIRNNRRDHPDAHWYHGEWERVIVRHPFRPSLVYLDTTSFVDHDPAARMTLRTIERCPPDTVLIVNSIWKNPRGSQVFDHRALYSNIESRLSSVVAKYWQTDFPIYAYQATNHTPMIMYTFYRRPQ